MVKSSFYILSSFFLFLFGIFMFFMGFYFIYYSKVYFFDWEFISFNSVMLTMTLIFDWMSMFFCGSVFFISSMVVFYSYSYMYNDVNQVRFLYLVLMFIFSMFVLIMSPNMVSILLGWDGLGLVSYSLVIYFQNYNSYSAGMLTILTNRIGDAAILLCISWMLNYGSWHYLYYLNLFEDWMFYMFIFLVLSAFTKSAQIPFSSWLPAAMAAPTPVSALVHSSTLVTAGVYLLIRFSNFLYMFDCNFFLILSLMTMFMSGLNAALEFDLKKIIALSTLSQLGLMMVILFMGYSNLSFFHLLTHAFFKALLFLCAGLIIHVMNDTQDIRFMGGLSSQIPLTITCFVISNLSLCGFPFLSGFYSKDMILEIMSFNYYNLFIYAIMYISIGLTVLYTVRLIFYVMIFNVNSYSCQSYFEDIYMNISMMFLVLLAVISGSILSWMIFYTPVFIMIPLFMKIFSFVMIFFGLFLGYNFSMFFYNMNLSFLNFYFIGYFSSSMWFMPFFSTSFISSQFLFLSFNFQKSLELGWGEFIFSKLSFFFLVILSKFSQFYSYSNLKVYMLLFFFLIFLFLFY
uniref:NADH dehydrogenase subunit 5 n=1 Tax=Thetibates serena TaxID=2866982 RepID=UPI001EDD82A6|nr:NADH dehydrogenase subunit 5 [Thetibates serena]UIG88154.1 NADH dehydrogenase subunit 5 [Thetibates serena]UIG88174.1 NADH dehydrogenase subunit 5 [Thetibates serena]